MLPPGHSCHGITLPRPVECKLSCGLLLVVETRRGNNAVQEKITKRPFVHGLLLCNVQSILSEVC